MRMSQITLCFPRMEDALELCRYYNMCIRRNPLWVCECEENFADTNIDLAYCGRTHKAFWKIKHYYNH